MNSSAKTFLTAVIAVAAAATTALLLAEQGVPAQLHTVQAAPTPAADQHSATAPQAAAGRRDS
jgi:hypothetical protein